jgi:hypothetical protein
VSNDSQLSRNPPRACLWKENPNRLVTLWDIVRYFPVFDFKAMIDGIRTVEEQCEEIFVSVHGGMPLPNRMVEQLRGDLPRWHDLCDEYGFKDTAEKMWLFSVSLREEGETTHVDVSECRTELQHISSSLYQGMISEHAYAHILPLRKSYAFQDDLFGADVSKAFPSARYDLREAGNCYAVDCNTAAIFHLMRVSEYGLRALARDRRVTVPSGVLELATWEQIIKSLEEAELAIQKYTKTIAREAQFEFYHGVMMEFRSFKNIWRNRYSHTRAGFTEDDEGREADRVMQRVGDFMKRLATVISEKKRTPIIWKRAYNKS